MINSSSKEEAMVKGRRYNLTKAAKRIGVHRLTLYYWMKKGWIKLHRDHRGFPVFTEADIKKIILWHKKLR
ncbi:MAG: MerR family transcriptional regulator [Candidatus Omnitrophica bacterium]|nr:MerR family transcriptional regulator [Candidatus Omnitrophota bacterium]